MSTWVIAGGVALLAAVGGGIGAFALGLGPFAHYVKPAIVAVATPSPSVLSSPTPDAITSPTGTPSPTSSPSPSASAETTPSPSPSPTRQTTMTTTTSTHTTTSAPPPPPPPQPGPISISGVNMWVQTSGPGPCTTACDAAAYSSPGSSAYPLANCHTGATLYFYEEYPWTFPGPAGTKQTVNAVYTGSYPLSGGGTHTINASAASQPALTSGSSGSHPHSAPPTFTLAPDPNAANGGTNQLTLTLTWKNPNDGSTGTRSLSYTFYWLCG